MTKTNLIRWLKEKVSAEELRLIVFGEMPNISKYNAQQILRLCLDERQDDTLVDVKKVGQLEGITDAYLALYFADHPEAWKWIFIVCAYRTFVLEKPMHSWKSVHYRTEVVNGVSSYICDYKNPEPNTNCSFCVCREAAK